VGLPLPEKIIIGIPRGEHNTHLTFYNLKQILKQRNRILILLTLLLQMLQQLQCYGKVEMLDKT